MYDEFKFTCLICKHKWIIRADRKISDKEYWTWFKKAKKEHKQIHPETKQK